MTQGAGRVMSTGGGATEGGFDLLLSAGKLQLRIDGQAAATAGTSLVGTNWVYFAVTYDGTKTGSNVQYYIGDGTNITADGLTSIDVGAVDDSGLNLTIGNHPVLARNMSGWLDNVRVYGGTGTNGIASVEELTTAMQYSDMIFEMPPIDITTEVLPETGEFVLSWLSGVTFNYMIESKDSLTSTEWTTNETEIVGTGFGMTYTTDVSRAQSFFRVLGASAE